MRLYLAKSRPGAFSHLPAEAWFSKMSLNDLDGWTQRSNFTAQDLDGLRPDELYSLRGKTAVVTGAGGGIGRWLAAGLGAAGAKLYLTDIAEPGLAELAEAVAAAGVMVDYGIHDLAQAGVAVDLIDQASAWAGSIDVLVNCAAINRRSAIFDVTDQVFDDILSIDLKAPYFLAKAAAKAMSQGGGGSVINIGSINVAIGLEGVSVYGAAKAGLDQLAKVMSVEWSHLGVRTNSLCPGFMMTPLSRAVWDDESRREWILDRVPMRRPGLPRDLVGACCLLASEAGSFITGHTLYVDGGFLAGSRWSAKEDGATLSPG